MNAVQPARHDRPQITRPHSVEAHATRARPAPSCLSCDQPIPLPPGIQPVTIAVIDSGFDLQHRALNFVDPQYHLDVRNYLRAKQQLTARQFVASHYTGPSRIPHGTAVAGIAAAKPFRAQADGRLYQGVAPGFPVLPVRVSRRPSATEIATGINWAVKHGARVICLSLKSVHTLILDNAINNATQRGVVVVAAAGNYSKRYPNRRIDYPAAYPGVLAVGATDRRGRRKMIDSRVGADWGSQYGPGLDVMAQGVDVPTIDETGLRGYVSGDVNLQSIGTSVAAPQVAGLAARLLAVEPAMTALEVFDCIAGTCDQTGPYLYRRVKGRRWKWNEEMGHGRINVERALATFSA